MSAYAPTGPRPTNSYAGLYRGTERGLTFGEALRRMAESGRGASRSERSRWQENRLFYSGEQWVERTHAGATVGSSVRILRENPRNLSKRVTVNRLRQMTDGRVALLTHQRPPFEVEPPSRDQDALEASRQATKFMAAQWGGEGWDIETVLQELALAGEIDNVAFLCVIYDREKGKKVDLPMTRPEGPRAGGGAGPPRPITNPAELEALKTSDPAGEFLWQMTQVRAGDVVFRVVRPGGLSIDPFAITDFRQARWIVESRIRPREEVERLAGRKLDDLVDQSEVNMGNRPGGVDSDSGLVGYEDTDGQSRQMSRRDAVMVHTAYVKPHGDWPRGAHCEWVDQAPGEPLIAEPWDDDLPYMAYVPKPDGGNFMRAKGTVDDLKPVQRDFNQTLTYLNQWLRRLAYPPVFVPIGSMRGTELYTEDGLVPVHPIGDPHFMPHAPEPAAVFSQKLQWCIDQMAEIAAQSAPTRGFAPGQGVESQIAIAQLAQNSEQQMSGTAKRFVRVIEWGCSRALKLVGKHYIIPRLVSSPGVDDEQEFAAFTGAQLRGCTKFRVTGQILPKLRAQQLQTLMAMLPLLGPESIRPHIAKLIDGDLDEFMVAAERQAMRQRRENGQMAAIGRLGKGVLDAIWQEFQQDVQTYAQALQMAMAQAQRLADQQAVAQEMMVGEANAQMGQQAQTQQQAGNGKPPQPMLPPEPPRPMAPEQILAAQGIQPPRIIDRLKAMGVPVPAVEDFDDDAEHLRVLDQWRLTDGFEAPATHPVVRQVAREHGTDHQRGMAQQIAGLGPPQPRAGAGGSQPAPKGQPSQPRQPGQAGGQAGMPQPTVTP